VELTSGPRRIHLRIADDGIGKAVTGSEGLGLTRAREEILSLDGTLEIVSVPFKGTTIEASVPTKEPFPLET
jgi:signal transduction histidine kinase